jgi:hypothetical protein
MNTSELAAITAHLRACEEALIDPAVRRDRARVSAMLAEDFVEIGSSGRVWSRDQILHLMSTEKLDPPVIEDFLCRAIATDVVLVCYTTVPTDAATGQCSIVLRSSLWTNVSGVWLLRFHQGTRSASTASAP